MPLDGSELFRSNDTCLDVVNRMIEILPETNWIKGQMNRVGAGATPSRAYCLMGAMRQAIADRIPKFNQDRIEHDVSLHIVKDLRRLSVVTGFPYTVRQAMQDNPPRMLTDQGQYQGKIVLFNDHPDTRYDHIATVLMSVRGQLQREVFHAI